MEKAYDLVMKLHQHYIFILSEIEIRRPTMEMQGLIKDGTGVIFSRGYVCGCVFVDRFPMACEQKST